MFYLFQVDTIARTTLHEHFTTTQATSTTPVTVSAGGTPAGLPVSHNQGVNMTTSPPFTITPNSECDNKIQHSINSITNNNNHMVNNNNTTAFPYNNSIKKEPVSSLEIIPTQMKSCPTVNSTSTVLSTHTNNG